MTTASASIDALFHTGTDQSPLGESSEYVLKTLLPAITLLADRAISPAEFAATVSRVADTKADLEDVVGLSKRMENAESRIKTLTEATRSLHAVESQVAELTGAVNLIDTDKINACLLYTSPSPRDRQMSSE